MKKLGVAATLVAFVIVLFGAAPVTDAATRPPKNLKKVGDHWTPWDPPEPGPDAYIIQKGDTLWDLAGKWFGDPFLWPQIWDENRYILDSHWIYPGDPLVVPGQPTVIPDEGPEVADGPPVTDERPPVVLPEPVPLVPVADATDIYCSGYIDSATEHTPDLYIAGRDTERHIVGEGDVVFLNQGRNQGVASGDEYAILRWTDRVRHPTTGTELGTFVRRMGRLRVMLAHDDTSTAMIEMSCEDIVDGDELLPWSEIPVPMISSVPELDRYDPTPSGGPTGQIVTVKDDLSAFGQGNVIYTDLGRVSGVTPGDMLVLYRDREQGLPRMLLGQAVILTVEDETSTAKILSSTRESGIGDQVEVWR